MKNVVIAGIAETPIIYKSGKSAYSFAGEAFSGLLKATGINKAAIDGLCTTAALSEAANAFHPAHIAELFGLSLSWLLQCSVGGASMLSGVANAASAIRAGQCSIALVLGADAPSSRNTSSYGSYRPEFVQPVGPIRPPEAFALLMRAYEKRYRLDYEALAKIVVEQRQNAKSNPLAVEKLKTPLSVDDYFSSRVIAEPLRLLDSVMFCDGANAVLVMDEAHARNLAISNFVRVLSYGERSNPQGDDPLSDLLHTGFGAATAQALEGAGVSIGDVEFLQLYDDFTIAIILQLEQMGFCGPGEGSEFILKNDIGIKGALPINTGGGQLSAGQPGFASGGLGLVEAVRQLLGTAGSRQLLSQPRIGLVSGIGGIPYGRNWMTSNVMLLGSA